MDAVDDKHEVFVTAQGLFRYFAERDVQRLSAAIVERFPGVYLMFDIIPRWLLPLLVKRPSGSNSIPSVVLVRSQGEAS